MGKIIDIGLMGNQHVSKEERRFQAFADMYAKLFSIEFDGKPLWEHIKNEKFTSAPHFVGNLYEERRSARLMVVGRAVNGWEMDFRSACSAPDLSQLVMRQKAPFEDIVNKDGFKSKTNPKKRPYRYITSRFWKLVKAVLEEFKESDIAKNPNGFDSETWYHDSHSWHQRVLWSNLYKVAPYSGGNPGIKLRRAQLQSCLEILRAELITYKPKKVLFITDLDDYMALSKEEKTFLDIIEKKHSLAENTKCVVAAGYYGKTKIVVCKRPDFVGSSDAYVHEMAKEIAEVFEELEKADSACKEEIKASR